MGMLVFQYKTGFNAECAGQTPYGLDPCSADPNIILSNDNHTAVASGGIDMVRSYNTIPRPGVDTSLPVYAGEFTIDSSSGVYNTRMTLGIVNADVDLTGGDRLGIVSSSTGIEIQSQYSTAAIRSRTSWGSQGSQSPQVVTGDIISVMLEPYDATYFKVRMQLNGVNLPFHYFPIADGPVYLAASIHSTGGDQVTLNSSGGGGGAHTPIDDDGGNGIFWENWID